MRFLFVLIATAILQLPAAAQVTPFAGDWQGKLANTELRLVFHFTETGGVLSATMDSPDQNMKGLKCDAVTVNGDTITVKLNSAAASYTGVLSADKKTIAGKWSQRGAAAGLDLAKGVTEALRPQTPRPPFAYVSEDVEYDNKDKSIHFGGTFTKPKGTGKFPAVIIISGSGTQDRNGTLFDHQPYFVLADHLTKNGIAVLRVDDRGAGKTTLGKDTFQVTSADFANDVEAGIAFLKSRADVDFKKIGLIGHSEGGMIAPMVAVRNPSVVFIVLLAGPGQTGEAIWKYQMRNSFVQPNLTAAHKKLADSLVDQMNDAFKHSTNLPTIQQEMTATYKSWKQNVSDSLEKTLFKAPIGLSFYQLANNSKNALHWLHYFINYDPAPVLQQVKCPVLAINGEADVQVVAENNLAGIERALKKGGNKNYTIKAFPQLNHLFQTTTHPGQSYGAIEETFAPAALDFITQWIRQQTK